MLLITCPVTGREELIGPSGIRSITNLPTSIDVTVACPCGATHVHRTGRRWEADHQPAARRAAELVPA